MAAAAARGELDLNGIGGRMSQTARFQETLRRLAIFDESLAGAEPGPHLAGPAALDGKTVGLLQVAASVALGSSAVCLQWSTARALAAGATKEEVADVLLAIAPMAGLGRVVSAAPKVAAALDYDIDAALEEPGDR
jgi:alkylhydroperoxidase/carboxymuconolactone decarboxylase family protein YurZ